jgi:hypothetical protein
MSNSLEHFIENYNQYENLAEVRVHSYVEKGSRRYPLVSVHFGNKSAPTLVMTGGVHGLERIGAQLTLNMLDSFYQRLSWDTALAGMLSQIQIVFIPLVNPFGYFDVTRSNANGVDLMRNAPIDAEEKVPFLLGGHRHSAKLSWYRGERVEQESQFVFDVMAEVLKNSHCVISLDCHSGFGFRDQLWFPFANSKKQFTQINQMYMFFELFEKTHPHHIYKIEPQSKNYMTHGDMWDYCFYNFKKENQVYLPLTLEMGSWIWVKKNPLQLFTRTGMYNPVKQHRLNRTMRRHRPFFDYILHSLYSHHVWTSDEMINSKLISEKAKALYYG